MSLVTRIAALAQAIAADIKALNAAVGPAAGAIYEHGQTVTQDHTIPVGKNGVSAGPITIQTGVTVTISTNSVLVIV